MTASRNPTCRTTFPARVRLRSTSDFLPIYKTAIKINEGPLLFYGRPNDRTHPRLGLSVSRRVGTAIKRNRIKRLLREAFRLSQHDWPAGYDVVISVRPHEPMSLADYHKALAQAMHAIHQAWMKKHTKSSPRTDPGAPPAS